MADEKATDALRSRNNTKVYIQINGERVGRIQSIREDINNNVQVLTELGRAFAVELKKGITIYTFAVAKFYCRNDALEALKLGEVFSLLIRDGDELAPQTLEMFEACSITSLSRDYTTGQASIVENAQVVTIGKGVTDPK